MRCVAIGSHTARTQDIPIRQWRLSRGSTQGIFPLATRAEADLLRASAAADLGARLKTQGFSPQLIIGHPGWGETILLAGVFPEAKQILHGEYFYKAEGADVGFDPEFGSLDQDLRMSVISKNAGLALAYVQADRIVCPTEFQASVFPRALREQVSVIHEGVDTARVKRNPEAKLRLPGGLVLDRNTPVITFINRNFEPLRGVHTFMRALPEFMAAVPDAHVIMIGADAGGYTGGRKDKPWRMAMLDELQGRLDLKRLHFPGRVPHNVMVEALSVSTAHVYYTYPFVLSWSLLEAMACECLVLGSDTAPVRDAVTDGVDGRLLDFFDVQALSTAMIDACRSPKKYEAMRQAARKTVLDRFDRSSLCEPAWMKLVDEVLEIGR